MLKAIADRLQEANQLCAQQDWPPGDPVRGYVRLDGRRPDAVEKSLESARRFAEGKIPAVVIDVEAGAIRLQLAHELAEVLGAPCLALDQLEQGSLEAAIRLRLGEPAQRG